MTIAPWLEIAIPGAATLASLWIGRMAYLWQRAASFARRQKRRKEKPAHSLHIPSRVKKPEEYSGGQTLHQAQWTYLERAAEAQGGYFAKSILAAVLPPMALFLLSVQILALPSGGNWAVGLILSETGCLAILVFVALTSQEPTAEWVENRIRTELFRREQYLSLVGIGPYLSDGPAGEADEALRRRGQIEGARARTLIELVPMQEPSGLTWLEALHHKGSLNLGTHPDLIERMESYFYYRIGKQLLWFANEIRDIQESDRTWSRLLTGALLASITLSVLHTLHLGEHHSSDGAEPLWGILIGMLAIVLPPLGTAFLAIRAMYNLRGRRRIYEHEKSLLHLHSGALQALIENAKRVSRDTSNRHANNIDFDFRAVALRTEQSLSIELLQWLLLMEREDIEVSS